MTTRRLPIQKVQAAAFLRRWFAFLSVIVLLSGCRNDDLTTASQNSSNSNTPTAVIPEETPNEELPAEENLVEELHAEDSPEIKPPKVMIPAPTVAPELQKILKEESRFSFNRTKLAVVTEFLSQVHQNKFKFEIFGLFGQTVVTIDSRGPFEDLLDEMLEPTDLTWKAEGTKIFILPEEEANQE